VIQGRPAQLLLAVSMFVMGACGLVYEYVLSVLGNYLIGSSHEEIFVVIGLMLFAMGIGSAIQVRLKSDLVAWFLRLEILLGVLGGLSAPVVYGVFVVSPAYRAVLYGFAGAIGILIGMEIPILIRINRQYAGSLRTNLSQILSMDYVGSLCGALVFTYVLLARVDLARIGFILGLANVLVALAGLVAFRSVVARPRLHFGLVAVAAVGLTYGLYAAPAWTAWFEQRLFRDPIVHRERSPYQLLVLTRSQGGERLNLHLNGHLQFSSLDEHVYHETLVHPAMTLAPRRRRVLILGGGDGLALRDVLRYPDVEAVTLVDLDPAVVRLASTHPDLVALNEGAFADARVTTGVVDVEPGEEVPVRLEGDRYRARTSDRFEDVGRVHVALYDADAFLRETDGLYDVALLDFPDPGRLETAKLYSREFYTQLRARLRPDALVALQATSPIHAKRGFLCIGATLRAAGFTALPYHQNVPSFGEWGFYLARPGPGAEELLRREVRAIESFDVPTRFLTPGVLAGQTEFGRGWLDPETPIEPNTKMNPVLVRYYQEAWEHY